MRRRCLASMGVLAAGLAVVSLAAVPVAGQTPTATPKAAAKTWTPVRTPWGDPDLQGSWENRSPVPLERPKQFGTREFLTEQEAAERAKHRAEADDDEGGLPAGGDDKTPTKLAQADVKREAAWKGPDPGKPGYKISGIEYNSFWNAPVNPRQASNRTSQVVDPKDGQVPPLTPETLKRWEAKEEARRGRGEADSWLDRNVMERCLLRSGLAMGEANTEKEIFQAPGYVAIHMMYGYVRIIPLDGRPHVGSAIRQWNGDSRGHWEGDTLVVETTNFNDKQDGGALKPSHGGLFGYNHAHNYPGTGETLRLIERFRRLDADTIEYRYTIDDPKVFMAPWTAVNTWSADDKQDQEYEYTCHEHNYGMVNLLKGGRVQEQTSLDEAAREVRERQGQLKAAQEKLKSWQEAHGR